MLEIILVRHGETHSNIRKTYCGWTDSELNEKGINQAHRVSELLKTEEFSAVYSSPLKRAYATCSIICEGHKSEIITDARIKEQNFGDWEDLTYAEISENYPEDCTCWQKDWMNYCVKAGESPVQVYKRVSEFVDAITGSDKNGKVMVVTHLGCIRMIVAYMLGMAIEGFWRFSVDNGSVSRLVIDEGYAYLKSLNC